MKTQKQIISIFPSISSVTAILFSVCISMLLFVGQALAAEPSVDAPNKGVSTASIQENKNTPPADVVNVNKAGASVLSKSLKGVGLKKAQAIVDWRNKNGDFLQLEQLLEVKGIGEKILLANRHKMTL